MELLKIALKSRAHNFSAFLRLQRLLSLRDFHHDSSSSDSLPLSGVAGSSAQVVPEAQAGPAEVSEL